jgi:hypothetical protein
MNFRPCLQGIESVHDRHLGSSRQHGRKFLIDPGFSDVDGDKQQIVVELLMPEPKLFTLIGLGAAPSSFASRRRPI